MAILLSYSRFEDNQRREFYVYSCTNIMCRNTSAYRHFFVYIFRPQAVERSLSLRAMDLATASER